MKGWTLDVEGKGSTPVEQVQVGDSIRGFNLANGVDIFRKVQSKHIGPIGAGYVVKGQKVGPLTGVWDGQAWIAAFKVPGATFDGSPNIYVYLQVGPDEGGECNLWLLGDEPLLIRG